MDSDELAALADEWAFEPDTVEPDLDEAVYEDDLRYEESF